jgi:hypothetical protein
VNNHTQDENRALALAALALVKALVNAAEQKGVFKGSEIQEVLHQALTSLELRHQDVATDLARRIVEAFAITRRPEGST